MASKSIDWDGVLVTQDPNKKEIVVSFPADGYGSFAGPSDTDWEDAPGCIIDENIDSVKLFEYAAPNIIYSSDRLESAILWQYPIDSFLALGVRGVKVPVRAKNRAPVDRKYTIRAVVGTDSGLPGDTGQPVWPEEYLPAPAEVTIPAGELDGVGYLLLPENVNPGQDPIQRRDMFINATQGAYYVFDVVLDVPYNCQYEGSFDVLAFPCDSDQSLVFVVPYENSPLRHKVSFQNRDCPPDPPPPSEGEPVPPAEPLPECVSHSCSAFIDYMTENNYLSPYFYQGFSSASLDISSRLVYVEGIPYVKNEQDFTTEYFLFATASGATDSANSSTGEGILDSAGSPCTSETYYGAPRASSIKRSGPFLDIGYYIDGPKYAAGDDYSDPSIYVKSRSYSMSKSFAFIANCKDQNGDLVPAISFYYESTYRISINGGAGALTSFSGDLSQYTYYPQTGRMTINSYPNKDVFIGRPDNDGFVFMSFNVNKSVSWGTVPPAYFYMRAEEQSSLEISFYGASSATRNLESSTTFGDGAITVGKILTNDFQPGSYTTTFQISPANFSIESDYRIATLWLGEIPSSAAFIAFKRSLRSYTQPSYCEILQ